jgi:DNA-binding CsgD family transcriptional regulator
LVDRQGPFSTSIPENGGAFSTGDRQTAGSALGRRMRRLPVASSADPLIDARPLPIAIFIVDGDRRVVRANILADDVASEGTVLGVCEGQLVGRTIKISRFLAELLAMPKAHVSGTCGEVRVAVSVLENDPLDALGHTRGCKVVRVTGRVIDSLARRRFVRHCFAATPTEAEIADLIAQGYSVQTIATQLHRTPSTIRTHLKRLFAKTGTNSQRRLAASVRAAILCDDI